MADNGRVPEKIVELLIQQTNELAKNIPDKIINHFSRDVEQIEGGIIDIDSKINTPPRTEELDAKLDILLNTFLEIKEAIKNGMRAIIIAASVFGIAILIAVSVITYFNTSADKIKEPIKQVQHSSNLQKQIR